MGKLKFFTDLRELLYIYAVMMTAMGIVLALGGAVFLLVRLGLRAVS